MTLPTGIGLFVGLVVIPCVLLTIWWRRADKKEKERIRQLGFEPVAPVPPDVQSTIDALSRGAGSLQGQIRSGNPDSAIVRKVEELRVALYQAHHVPTVRTRGYSIIWLWLCDCPVWSEPFLITHEESLVRQLSNDWTLHAVDGPWVQRVVVEPTPELAVFYEQAARGVMEALKATNTECSALINNGAVGVAFDERELDSMYQINALLAVRRAVIEAGERAHLV